MFQEARPGLARAVIVLALSVAGVGCMVAEVRNKLGQFTKGHHWRKPKEHWNYYWLYAKYVILGQSAADIAKGQGCKDNNILYWLHKHGIQTRNISDARQLKHWGAGGEANGMFGAYGSANPNWKGGISAARQSLYSSFEWKAVSEEVWTRDKAICQRCGKYADGQSWHIHHVIPFDFEQYRTDPGNLVLLCISCHHWVHSRENEDNEFIG